MFVVIRFSPERHIEWMGLGGFCDPTRGPFDGSTYGLLDSRSMGVPGSVSLLGLFFVYAVRQRPKQRLERDDDEEISCLVCLLVFLGMWRFRGTGSV